MLAAATHTHDATLTQRADGLTPEVAQLDFERLRWKLEHSREATWGHAEIEDAEREYRRFLTLKQIHPDLALVPSKQVDAFWHAHFLDTVAYARDCEDVFGGFLHHYPYFGIYGDEDYAKLVAAFARTREVYEMRFGPYPGEALHAARCEGHACHAPSSCACRTPGACK